MEVDAFSELVAVRQKLYHLALDVRSRHPAFVGPKRHPLAIDRAERGSVCDREEVEKASTHRSEHSATGEIALDIVQCVSAYGVPN